MATIYDAYNKPNMCNIKGELGANIMRTIRAAPSPDFTESDKRCKELDRRMRQAIKDGTF